jgi:hypothetical protein
MLSQVQSLGKQLIHGAVDKSKGVVGAGLNVVGVGSGPKKGKYTVMKEGVLHLRAPGTYVHEKHIPTPMMF